MKDLFKIIATYDAEGRGIIENANDEANRIISQAKAESDSMVDAANHELENFENELKKKLHEKIQALKHAHEAELERQTGILKSVVAKNKKKTTEAGLGLIETLK